MHAAEGTHYPHRPLGGIRDKMGILLVHLGKLGTVTSDGLLSSRRFSLAVVLRSLLCAVEKLQTKPDPVLRPL